MLNIKVQRLKCYRNKKIKTVYFTLLYFSRNSLPANVDFSSLPRFIQSVEQVG